MTLFRHPDLQSAYAHVAAGGQALYLRRKREGELQDAWLIDADVRRLIGTAKRLGVRRIRVLRADRVGQCVELNAHQLSRALLECRTAEMNFA